MDVEKKLRVLVVEDDANLLNIYRMAFDADGRFEGRFTHDGGHAAALLRGDAFDAVVVDIRLPTMNGLHVAAVARSSELNRQVPIYIVSGLVNAETMARAESLGRTKVIEKPLEPKALMGAIVEAAAARKNAAYDAPTLNAVLAACHASLAAWFGAGEAKAGRPGVRKGQLALRTGQVSLIQLHCGTASGHLALVANPSFVEALKLANSEAATPSPGSAILVDLAAQVGVRLEQLLAEGRASTRVGRPHLASFEELLDVQKGAAVLYFPFAVGDGVVELELSLVPGCAPAEDEKKAGALIFDS